MSLRLTPSMISARRRCHPVARPLPPGALPVECAPFRAHAADVTQRLSCSRRQECLLHAARAGWRSFTCAHCAVRETSKTEAPSSFVGVDVAVEYPVCR